MVSITENEARVVEFLLRNFDSDYNINQIAKSIHLSPRGAFKILKKLESSKILSSQKIGNNLIYKINFDNDQCIDVCQFVLTGKEVTPYLKTWINDLQPLKEITEMALLFGSILTKEKQANDVDLLLVFPKDNLQKVDDKIKKINQIKSKKIHLVVQTKEDLLNNLKKRDSALLEEIKTGLVLWGRNVLVEVIKHDQNR